MGARHQAGRAGLARTAAFFATGFLAGMAAALLSPVRAGRVTR